MGRILRVGLMVLLVAAADVGIARGEWNDYKLDGITWQYEQIDATTCRIQIPKGNRSSISGSVTIPSKVEDGSLSLTVVEIAKEAFYMCSKLTGVKFPSGLITIGSHAFFDCSNLTGVKFPSGVQTIGESAFYGCGLTEVTIYSSVREIGDKAFSCCTKLTAFQVDAENASYSQDGGVLFTKDRDTLVSYPGGRKGDYEIPSSVMGISVGAFAGCEGLTAVVIPSSVKTIEEWTFDGCSELTGVEFPSGLTTIGDYAFFLLQQADGGEVP